MTKPLERTDTVDITFTRDELSLLRDMLEYELETRRAEASGLIAALVLKYLSALLGKIQGGIDRYDA